MLQKLLGAARRVSSASTADWKSSAAAGFAAPLRGGSRSGDVVVGAFHLSEPIHYKTIIGKWKRTATAFDSVYHSQLDEICLFVVSKLFDSFLLREKYMQRSLNIFLLDAAEQLRIKPTREHRGTGDGSTVRCENM